MTMTGELRSALRPAVVVLLALTALTGLAYPLVVTGIAQALMPGKSNGSLITDGNRVIGSQLIGQRFAKPGYFHPRPSAAGKEGYDAGASAGSNLAPGSKDLHDAIEGRIADLRAQRLKGPVPADLVTTSASGLDPEISPEAAFFQIPRVAKARGFDPQALHALVERQVSKPLLGFIGEPRVNVLELNRQVDRMGLLPPG
jgi:K+-transporting ATPase ATPase C chain